MPSGLFYLNSLDGSISKRRGIWLFSCVWLFILLPCFIEFLEFNTNSVDPDQTPRSAASDLGLHGLLMSLLWDIGLERQESKRELTNIASLVKYGGIINHVYQVP